MGVIFLPCSCRAGERALRTERQCETLRRDKFSSACVGAHLARANRAAKNTRYFVPRGDVDAAGSRPKHSARTRPDREAKNGLKLGLRN